MAAIDVNPESLQSFEAPHNAIGHQGLFFERFYAAAGESLLTDPPLTVADPAAGLPTGLYHNRNRWYSPSLGRFATRDPNETAMPIVAALASNGEAWWILLNGFDPTGHYADGLNVYQYALGNPQGHLDPSGAFSLAGLFGRVTTEISLNAIVPGCTAAGMWAVRGVMTAIAAYNVYLLATQPDYLAQLSEDVAMALTLPGATATMNHLAYLTRSARSMRAAAGGSIEVGESLGAAVARNLKFHDERKLQHMFGKHAPDFGLKGNWNKDAGPAMEQAIRAFVGKATAIPGNYRTPTGDVSGTYWYDAATSVFVFVDNANNVLGGWKLNPNQEASLLSQGWVQ